MARAAEGRKVNRSELSGIFGVSLPTVDMWVRSGCPGIKVGAGKGGGWEFDTAEVSQWLQKRAADNAAGSPELADENAIKRRRAAISLKADELDLAQRMGLVAPIEEFERAQAKMFAMLRQSVMTVPARVAMSLVNEKSEIRIKQVLAAELADALNRVAEADLELDDEAGDE